jgi:hypothetical protein
MPLIKCSECQKEISNLAEACPHCGAPSKGKAIAKTGTGIASAGCLLILVAVFFAIISGVTSPGKKVPAINPQSIPTPETSGLELQKGWKFTTGKYGNSIITGTVKNNSSKTYSYAHITFGVYDKENAKIGTALANIDNLEANGSWKFEASVLQDNAYTVKLEEVRGL